MAEGNGRRTYTEYDDGVCIYLGLLSDCRERFYPLLMVGGFYGYGGNAAFGPTEQFDLAAEGLVGEFPLLGTLTPSDATDAEVQQLYQEREAISPVAVTNRHLVPWS